MEPVTKIQRLEAELKLAKLEDKFVQAKEAGKLTTKMKNDLRAARADYRFNYRAAPAAGAQPATVTAGGKVQG